MRNTIREARAVHAMLLAMLLSLLVGCTSELPMDEREKDLFVRAQDFVELGFELGSGFERHEVFSKERYFDGSHEIEYTFEPDESRAEDYIYLYSMLSAETSASDAIVTYKASELGFRIGYLGNEIEAKEDNAFFRFGDESKFTRLYHDGEEFGNMFITRAKDRVYLFACFGVYFDDPEMLAGLLEPRLRAFSEYSLE